MELLDANPWMKSTKLVVKPDMLFGKRGKHDLVGLNLDFAGVESFIKARMGKVSRRLLEHLVNIHVHLWMIFFGHPLQPVLAETLLI